MMQSTGTQVERDGIWSRARKVAMVLMSDDRSCEGEDEAILGF
jgi:hypothetical protein